MENKKLYFELLFRSQNKQKKIFQVTYSIVQPTLINLHPNKYNIELHYYPFVTKLDRCVGRRNILNDLPSKVYVPNKTEDLNIHVLIWLQEKMDQKF